MMPTRDWVPALELDRARGRVAGSPEALADAIRRGADLRLYTTFDWFEHMQSNEDEGLVQESIDLRVAYLIDDRWTAALTPLRYPANAGLGFGAVPSLSFFMYNQNAQFGIARPYWRGRGAAAVAPLTGAPSHDYGPHYHMLDHDDGGGPCPSHNAFFDFNVYRWLVADDWTELLAHDARGHATAGSLEDLTDAFRAGRSIKVAVRDLCRDLAPDGPAHEVFVELGSLYNHLGQGFFSGESLPLVRIAPAIPLAYQSGNWDAGWILPRTDGVVFQLRFDPRTREVTRAESHHAIRWFAR